MKVKWILLVLTLLIAGIVLAGPTKIVVNRNTGDEWCVRIIDHSDGDVWDHTNNNWNIANDTSSDGYLDLTQDTKTSIRYTASFPSAITTAGYYEIQLFNATAATVNIISNYDGGETVYWTGSELIEGKVDVRYVNGDTYATTNSIAGSYSIGDTVITFNSETGLELGNTVVITDSGGHVHTAILTSQVSGSIWTISPGLSDTITTSANAVVYALPLLNTTITSSLSTQAKADVQAEVEDGLETYSIDKVYEQLLNTWMVQ